MGGSDFLKVSKVVKAEKNREIEYTVEAGTVTITSDGRKIRTIPRWKFGSFAELLLERMMEHPGKGAFGIPEMETFLDDLDLETLKSASNCKTDISVMALNAINEKSLMRFSVKSELGGKPTLLNASNATRMEFAVEGLPQERIGEINAIEGNSKIKRRIQAIYGYKGHLVPRGAVHPVFRRNLGMVDSRFDELISAMMLCHYLNDKSSAKIPEDKKPYLVRNLVEQVKRDRPVAGMDPDSYEYHVKLFLTHAALGMRAEEPWNEKEETDGGFINVEKDGSLHVIPLQNRDELMAFLYEGTRLDTPAGDRTDNGRLVVEGNELLIRLTLQIRFA